MFSFVDVIAGATQFIMSHMWIFTSIYTYAADSISFIAEGASVIGSFAANAGITDAIASGLDVVGTAVVSGAAGATSLVTDTGVGHAIGEAASSVATGATQVVNSGIGQIVGKAASAIAESGVGAAASDVASTVGTGVAAGASAIGETVTSGMDAVGNTVGDHAKTVGKPIGKGVVGAISNGGETALSGAEAAARHFAGGRRTRASQDNRSKREKLQDDLNQEIFQTTRLVRLFPRVPAHAPQHTYFALVSVSKKRAACTYILRIPDTYFDHSYPSDFYMSQSMMFTYRALYILSVPREYVRFRETTIQKLPEKFRTSAGKYFTKMHKNVNKIVERYHLQLTVAQRTPKQMMLDACCAVPPRKTGWRTFTKKTQARTCVRAKSKNCIGYIRLLNNNNALKDAGLIHTTRYGNFDVNCERLAHPSDDK